MNFICCINICLPERKQAPFVKKENNTDCAVTTYVSKSSFDKGTFHFFFLSAILLVQSSSLKAQQENNYAVQANIIYHFTKYIDWPPSAKTGDFIIGVIGDTPLYEELKENIVNKKAGDQRIVVRKISSAESSYSCHILFISEDESNSIKKIVLRTTGIPVLLVSESEGLGQKGSCINFAIVSDHLKLEINKNNIEQRGLSIASELLKLGKIVK
jgi:hypothetical protein